MQRRSTASVATADAARERSCSTRLRARPFEDLGFARVDHHRAVRQGFPKSSSA